MYFHFTLLFLLKLINNNVPLQRRATCFTNRNFNET